ncbi:hypothetical protein FRC09_019831 [Ceratobasidium sp. 395]|nr:hypothetical protein FRC09_019831 [Ceratobasidium sp. 395]
MAHRVRSIAGLSHKPRPKITDVSSTNFTCNAGGRLAGPTRTATVQAGSTIGFELDEAIFHHGVANVYMAKAPNTATTFDGSGKVWFKVYQVSPVTDGGQSITFPTDNITTMKFKIPSSIPSGEYLVRVEHIALHLAITYQKAEFYISCAQINVIGGGSGVPGPLVTFPGYYTGKEPGILINIYSPVVCLALLILVSVLIKLRSQPHIFSQVPLFGVVDFRMPPTSPGRFAEQVDILVATIMAQLASSVDVEVECETVSLRCPILIRTFARAFESILRQTPDTVTEVIVETGGEWHTRDKKYSSPGWKDSNSRNLVPRDGSASENDPIVIDLDESEESDVEIIASNIHRQPSRSPTYVKDKPEKPATDSKCVYQ